MVRWEVTEVRSNLNYFKCSKGKKLVWEKIFDTSTEHCKMPAGIGSSMPRLFERQITLSTR